MNKDKKSDSAEKRDKGNKKEKEEKKDEEDIDEELEQTFPASDPPSYSKPGNDTNEDK